MRNDLLPARQGTQNIGIAWAATAAAAGNIAAHLECANVEVAGHGIQASVWLLQDRVGQLLWAEVAKDISQGPKLVFKHLHRQCQPVMCLHRGNDDKRMSARVPSLASDNRTHEASLFCGCFLKRKLRQAAREEASTFCVIHCGTGWRRSFPKRPCTKMYTEGRVG